MNADARAARSPASWQAGANGASAPTQAAAEASAAAGSSPAPTQAHAAADAGARGGAAGEALPPWSGPAILLVDLDAFFASVEQLDHPGWRGKPVIVGGDADKRGVVSTASYEARAFGVHSAMPSSQAARLCPQAIWTHGHFDRYRRMSNAVMDILRDETPFVQQVSIDEAFLDVTPNAVNREHPANIARRIQARVEALGVTCSIGVGTSKNVAKIASDMDKPRGLTVVFPGSERAFLDPLPVRAMSGIGAAAEAVLKSRGIETIGDLASRDEAYLTKLLGKNGRTMWIRANGRDDTPVASDDAVKSVSNETSFAVDLTRRRDVEAAVSSMAAKVGRRLRRRGLRGRTLGLRVRLGDRTVHSVQRQLVEPTDDELFFTPLLLAMLADVWREGMPVRLVGVAVTGFEAQSFVQESLFDADAFGLPEDENAPDQAGASRRSQDAGGPLVADASKRRSLLEATDKLRERFGDDAVRFGHELRSSANTTGSSSKNIADYK